MPKCTADRIEFGRLGRRVIEANFDGGDISSEGGLLLLRQVDERIGLTRAGRGLEPSARRAVHRPAPPSAVRTDPRRGRLRCPLARRPGTDAVPRLLRPLLLPAPVCVLRPSPAHLSAATEPHRRRQTRGGGDQAAGHALARGVAEHPLHRARRFRLLPSAFVRNTRRARILDALARNERIRLCGGVMMKYPG